MFVSKEYVFVESKVINKTKDGKTSSFAFLTVANPKTYEKFTFFQKEAVQYNAEVGKPVTVQLIPQEFNGKTSVVAELISG